MSLPVIEQPIINHEDILLIAVEYGQGTTGVWAQLQTWNGALKVKDRINLTTAAARTRYSKDVNAALPEVSVGDCADSLLDLETKITRFLTDEEATQKKKAREKVGADERPQIDATQGDLPIITRDAWDALKRANDPVHLFRYGGRLARLEPDELGIIGPQDLNEARMRNEMGEAAVWFKTTKKGMLPVVPPQVVVTNVLATPSPPLPVLTRIVVAPVFSADGVLDMTPGYNADSRTYYAPAWDLIIPPIPQRPTTEDIARARALLVDELLGEFPFVGQAERANAVALSLLPYVRDMIDGATPLHLIEAPSAGSGKGLLAGALLLPAVGRTFSTMVEGGDDSEWRKRLTSALREARPAICLDNIRDTLDSASLASVLTCTDDQPWTDRLLGTNEMVRLMVRCAWVATANNPTTSTEIGRRCVRVRINPDVDRPWRRPADEFRHPQLTAWARAHRGELIAAGLTLVQAWIAEGRPNGALTMGSYESWSQVLGGILGVAGIPGFLTNMDEFFDASDSEGDVLRRFVGLWWDEFREDAVLTADLFPLAQQTDGIKLGRGGEHEQITTLGKILGKAQDRVVNGYRIRKGPLRIKKTTWYLAPTSPHKDSPEGGCGGVRGGYSNPTREKKTFDDRGGIEKKNILLSGSECHLPPLTPPHPPAHSSTTDKRLDAVPGVQRQDANISSDNIETVAAAGALPSAVLQPCVGGCGTLTPNGWECRNCRVGVAVSPPRVTVAVAPSHSSTITVGASYPDLSLRTLATVDDVQHALPALLAAPMVGFDTETTGLDPLTDRLRLVQLATQEGAYVLDARRVDPRVLAPLFDAPAGVGPLLVAQNAAFDLRFLHQAGLTTPATGRLFDTELADRLLTASAFKKGLAPVRHGLGAIAQRVLGLPLDKSEQKSDWAGALTEEQLRYAALDAAVLPLIAERLQADLAAAGLERVAALEMEALPAVAWLMETGVPFDAEGWRRLALQAEADTARIEQEMTALAGTGGLFAGAHTSVKWSSTQQVAAFLRERGHSDITSTDEAALHQLADASEPLAPLLLRHREASKRASTYGRDYLKHVHPLTGRIHASFRQLGSEAGRMSATDPNVQQVPRGKAYRACVRPGPGRVLVKADYAQIELRLAAQIAPDERLVEAFQRGDDLHTVTARRVLGKTDVTKADRQAAKAVNFGLLYGMGAKGLRQYAADEYGVCWTEQEAQTVRGKFFAEYRGLQAWHRSQTDDEVETRTIAGRRRLGVERYTEKLNTPVQGSGADGLKAALGRLWETRDRAPGAAPILAVHDEIVVECARGQAEQARDWVVDAMRRGMETVLQRVPAEVEATICRNWSGTPLDGGAP